MNDDNLFCIFWFLQLPDVLNCFSVCRQFFHIAQHELYWKSSCHDRFGKRAIETQEAYSYYDVFKKYYILDIFLMKHVDYGVKHNVSELKLSQYKLQNIPRELSLLCDLRILMLHNNELNSIPREIGRLYNLTHLILHCNRLESIPREIGQLHSLEVLDLGYNKLKSIPQEIGQVMCLRILKLDNNWLRSIPKEMELLLNLVVLHLHANLFQIEIYLDLLKLRSVTWYDNPIKDNDAAL